MKPIEESLRELMESIDRGSIASCQFCRVSGWPCSKHREPVRIFNNLDALLSQPSQPSGAEEPQEFEAWFKKNSGVILGSASTIHSVAEMTWLASQAAEKERCAKAVEGVWVSDNGAKVKERCVAAIRATPSTPEPPAEPKEQP